MEKTRLGVIGLGGVAQIVHLPILSKLNTVVLTAVADLNKNRLSTVADKFGVKDQYVNYKEMLKKTDLDAVVIATPTNTHMQIAVDCIKAKKNVLIEKPIALNFEEAKKINDAAKKFKTNVMVGMNFRFRPDAMLLKSIINGGEIGEPFYIKCGWSRKMSSDQKWFLQKSSAGGGVILDLGIVLLDLAIWFFDYPSIKSVTVQTYNHRTKKVEDSAVGFLRFKNSAVINFEISWSLHSETDSISMTVFGTEGTAHLNPLKAYKRVGASHIEYTPPMSSNIKNLYRKSYENELKHFIGAIRGNNPIMSSSEDALNRMKLLDSIYKSAETNSEIII